MRWAMSGSARRYGAADFHFGGRQRFLRSLDGIGLVLAHEGLCALDGIAAFEVVGAESHVVV